MGSIPTIHEKIRRLIPIFFGIMRRIAHEHLISWSFTMRCHHMLLVFCTMSICPTLTFTAVAEPATRPADQANIPVKEVVLFSSGVGYFEHSGKVVGEGQTTLHFKTDQINDILKSLVLEDLDGGKVGTVSYPNPAPLARTLKSFQVDIINNPPLADVLNQLRGAKVSVSLAAADDQLVLTVLDSGHGMSEEFLPVAFDRFTRAASSVIACPA